MNLRRRRRQAELRNELHCKPNLFLSRGSQRICIELAPDEWRGFFLRQLSSPQLIRKPLGIAGELSRCFGHWSSSPLDSGCRFRPAVFASIVVGIVIAFFQALTQIQEMTLTFIPKMLAIFGMLIATGPFMGAAAHL